MSAITSPFYPFPVAELGTVAMFNSACHGIPWLWWVAQQMNTASGAVKAPRCRGERLEALSWPDMGELSCLIFCVGVGKGRPAQGRFIQKSRYELGK